MENGQEQINNKTGRNVAKFAGCFIGTCLLSAALFLLWCGISYSMRLSVELIRVGITAWYALSGLIGGKSCAHVNVVPYLFAQLCWEAFFRDSVCLFLHTGTALDCAGGRKPDDSDLCTAAALLGSVRWKRSKGCVTVKKTFLMVTTVL